MKKYRFLSILCLMAVALMASAQKPVEINLWPNGAPNDNGNPKDTAKVIVYLPNAKKATGRCVVICPGGGYSHLAMAHEGKDWAPFFNNMGIAAVVLKYRMPKGNREIPVADAEEAVKLVRRNASAWHVNPNDVGIMGSSAGGHLASTLATHAAKDAKPDFQILFYPVISMIPGYGHQGSLDNFLGKDSKKKDQKDYSNDMQVTRSTPRAFIALSDDDHAVPPANGVNYYLELYRHDVPASLHVYPTGGHGWGSRNSFMYHNEMELELRAWLRSF
ncbi:MAG: alpha/beta hydrolase [Prevotella sp.]|nr:alpha/beta hydrolase [Prevotella sp.]MDD7047010.1 alpha/beta hydrolase [Prevotella sp.]MDY5546480.1 alpha/beta hydrolase [Prevotella sp.]